MGLAISELRGRSDLQKKLGMNPLVHDRRKIKGRLGDSVWNFLSLSTAQDEDEFNHYPHLTLGVNSKCIEAMVTVPNAVKGNIRPNLKKLGEDGFVGLAEKISSNLAPFLKQHTGAVPWFKGVQRRFPTRGSPAIIDAEINFDMRTAVSGGPPKTQPRWLSAAYSAFVQKEHSNYQIQIGVIFPHVKCPELQEPSAVDLIASSWLAYKPLIDLSH